MSMTAEISAQIKRELDEPARRVESWMQQYLSELPWPANLVEAMAYSLLGSGKRMRPILVIRGCEAVGGRPEAAMPAAAAIEMIHCFSLIHDDLPAMDDDDLRRGRPTLHRHTNEAMAILAGDALMGLSFQLLVTKVKPTELAARLIDELAAGTNAMIAGQVYDTLPDFDAAIAPAERLRTIPMWEGEAPAEPRKPSEARRSLALPARLSGTTPHQDYIIRLPIPHGKVVTQPT